MTPEQSVPTMGDHDGQKLTPREMVRAHAYPVLAAVSTVALVVIAASLAPIGKLAGYQGRCIEEMLAVYPETGNQQMKHFVAVRQCNGQL
jgi:hypothetical protein